jgi:hypothetical protein
MTKVNERTNVALQWVVRDPVNKSRAVEVTTNLRLFVGFLSTYMRMSHRTNVLDDLPSNIWLSVT